MPATHAVTNQPPPLVEHDVYAGDLALVEAVRRYGAETAALRDLGRLAGTAEAQRWGVEANASPPVLRTHDRYGHRLDEVEFHPSWHRLLTEAVGHGLAGAPWAGRVARRPGGRIPGLVAARGRARLPGVDDVLGGPGAAGRARTSPPRTSPG